MKKIVKYSILTAIAIALFLSSCVSELPYIPVEEKGYKTLSLHIALAESATRGISRPVCDGELLEFNSGDLYLWSSATQQVVRHFRIVRAGGVDHNFETGGFINRDLLDFDNATGSALLEIPNVPRHVNFVSIVGNTPHNNTQGNMSSIRNRLICITTQHSALTPKGQPQKPGIHLYAMNTVPNLGNAVESTPLRLRPTVARIEIGSIAGTGSIADFTVEGIFIDNHYRQARVLGSIPSHSGLLNNDPSPNRKERGMDSDLFQPGQPYFSFIPGSTNSGALFDLSTGHAYTSWQERPWRGRRPGVLGAPGYASLVVTPGGASNVTSCTAIGCTGHIDKPNVWAYQVFAHGATINHSPDHYYTRLPRVIIRLSNIHLIDGTEVTDNNDHPYRYVTVREFYDHNGAPVNGMRAGQVYHIATIWFDERDLGYTPNACPCLNAGGVLIGGACWAQSNVDLSQLGGFAASPTSFGMLFLWGCDIGWSYTHGVMGSPSHPTYRWDPAAAGGNGAWVANSPNLWAQPSVITSLTWNPLPSGYNQGPCPSGWRLPTSAEFAALRASSALWMGTVPTGPFALQAGVVYGNLSGAHVFLPAAGGRSVWGALTVQGTEGRYWIGELISALNPDNSSFRLNAGNLEHLVLSGGLRQHAFSVRCVAE